MRKFEKAWAATGKKLDMGKSCIRFRKVDDLALDVIAETIRTMPARKYIDIYESAIKQNVQEARRRNESRGAAKSTAATSSNAKVKVPKKATKGKPTKVAWSETMPQLVVPKNSCLPAE